MSYVFHLFLPRPGEDPLATAQEKSDDLPAGSPDPVIEAQKHRTAVALITLNFRLKHAPFDYDVMARFNGISITDAQTRYRQIEMCGPSDGNGVQITIFDDEVMISVPQWHEGKEAAQVFREIWSYFDLLARESSLLIYDPQLDRLVDLNNDFARVLRHYLQLVDLISQRRTKTAAPEETDLVPMGVGTLL